MMRGWIGVAMIALLAGCSVEAPAVANEATPAGTATPPAQTTAVPGADPIMNGSLQAWLTGSWSFEADCATDFTVHYRADGTLQNGEDSGRWTLDGETVVETITERFEMGGEAPEAVNPPETRRYAVARVDATHGIVTSPFNGKKVPILRC
jgi:hypothetical protein